MGDAGDVGPCAEVLAGVRSFKLQASLVSATKDDAQD